MPKLPALASVLLAAVLLLWTDAASAADVIIGSVLAVRGEVWREDGATHEALTAREPLHPADTIVSGAGKAKISLNDGSIISIGENSRVSLAEYQSVSNGLRTRLRLLAGALRLLVNRITAGGQFEIETDTALAAVRGTDWLIEAVPDRTSVAILRGAVAVSGRGAFAQTTVVLDRPGQGVDIRPGAAPGAVTPWGAQRLADTLARATYD